MNLMQNNYFGYVYGEHIDEIIKECNLAKNLDIVKDEYKNKVLSYYALHIANVYMDAHNRFIEGYLKDCEALNNQ